jgi:hypothetical protein
MAQGDPAPAKIKEHYENALQQNPGGMPFVVSSA